MSGPGSGALRLRWVAQVLDDRHRQSAVHPWITIWASMAQEDEQ